MSKSKKKKQDTARKKRYMQQSKTLKEAKIPRISSGTRLTMFAYSAWMFFISTEWIVKGILKKEQSFLRDGILYVIELGVSFQFQTFIIATLLLGFILLRFRAEWTMIAIYSTLITTFLAVIAPNVISRSGDWVEGTEFMIATANLSVENQRSKEVKELLDRSSFDLVAIIELSPEMHKELDKSNYEYGYFSSREDGFGIAVLSKIEPKEVDIKKFKVSKLPYLEMIVEFSGILTRIVAVHAMPPVGVNRLGVRNADFLELAEKVNNSKEPVIVLGDLNVSPWSFFFKQLLRRSKLIDGKAGFGLLTSWPRYFPPLQIPVDYILFSKEFTAVNTDRFTIPDSDHYGIVSEIGLAKGL